MRGFGMNADRPKKFVLFIFSLLHLFIFFIFSCRPGQETLAYEISLDKGWLIQAEEKTAAGGETLSGPKADLTGWLPAEVPSTVLAVLIKNGEYSDLFFGKNLEKIPRERFAGAWWYRTEFVLPEKMSGRCVRLIFHGVNYRANVWLNGEKIAGQDEILGAFRVFELDVSRTVRAGKNFLAVEVFPPKPGDFSIGFVDWNPQPPDKNMGLWRPVVVRLSGPVSIENPFVQSHVNLDSLDEAFLTITSDLINHGQHKIEGTMEVELENIILREKVMLEPGERWRVRFEPQKFHELHLRHPRLWWPYPWGEQNLYHLILRFKGEDGVSDERKVTFGIREVADYVNEEGHRGYMVNGQKILIRGGGWEDDIFLADDEPKLEAKVKYVRHMNLNAIRLEGFWGTSHKLYDLCDQNGILMMVGWSCHWEWDSYAGKPCDEYGGVQTPDEIELVSQSFRDQVLLWRNHPSILVWLLGSDKLPRPELERKYLDILKECDPGRPFLAAAASRTSKLSGPTRVKMNGPYDYVPPIYWFEDKKFGGAYGFNTETGPGPQPPPLESLKKMIPEDHLWPIDEVWNFHCARGQFGNLKRYAEALERRYGKPRDVHDFLRKAQVANYEAMRAMFEAFIAHRPQSTGIIQWMLNAAWPKLYWQLYDYYLMPNGAFYGAQKAGQPLHLLYHYAEKSIYAVNSYLQPRRGLRASVRLVDWKGREVYQTEIAVDLEANSSRLVVNLPPLPTEASVHFLDLRLKDESDRTLSDNFYWLAVRSDVMDYAATQWFVTPIKEFADFRPLEDLPPVELKVEWNYEVEGSEGRVWVSLENPNEVIAFFVEVKLQREKSGDSVLPVYWNDNYVSLLPGEKRILQASFLVDDLHGQRPVVVVSGWNVEN